MNIELVAMGKRAVVSKYELQTLSSEKRNNALFCVADELSNHTDEILAENQKDMEEGKKNGMPEGLLDRLLLTKERIQSMAEGLREIAALPNCIGECMESFERQNGLLIEKVRVPMGVIGIIYESRPNVTADAFGLCFKTGNAVILKGGSDALRTNLAIAEVIRNSLKKSGINPDAISLIKYTDRNITTEFMKMKEYVDVIIPRGGAGLIKAVVENSTIPVIETGTGNCHIYVDKDADFNMALDIIMNAKTQRIGVCNACESLVLHKDVLMEFLPILEKKLKEIPVEIRADEVAMEYLNDSVPATEEDFATEYLDYIISIKVVNSLEEAIVHINNYNTKHSDCIVTKNMERAEQFLNEVDTACVYINASTRFTDGYEFGFGAEIGISTQKLHARGPMGLKELTSYKYKIYGNGQIRK